MAAKFVVVPEWQGSSSSRSMRLIDGAEAIRGDLPSAATTTVEVPLGAGDAVGTAVHRYSAIATVRDRLAEALRRLPEEDPPIVIGGDCGVELGAIGHALGRHPGLAVVWFDAHPDLNTPATSPSGAFHGMVGRALLGDAADGLALDPPLAPARLLLAGVRACDPAEDDYIRSARLTLLEPEALADSTALVDAVAASGADAVYVHIDLDVIDPDEIDGVAFPEPFGVTVPVLIEAIRALRDRFPLVGAAITEFAPASPSDAQSDLPTVLRVLSALTARRS